MQIVPISFESIGVRSMSTFIETKDVNIIIDPGVSLAPYRYGLKPHPFEIKRLEYSWEKIVNFAKKSDIIIITHYHYDHHNLWDDLNIYDNKEVLIKHPKENINFSQKRRAEKFIEKIKEKAKIIDYIDEKEYNIGNTIIKFSKPVFHGIDSRLGYVIEVFIEENFRFIHTSDVEGLTQEEQLSFIIENQPSMIILDGPLSYIPNFLKEDTLEKSLNNIINVIYKCPLEILILDHHFLRDLEWRKIAKKIFEVAKELNVKIQTAAQYMKLPLDMLEANRKKLYEEYPKAKYIGRKDKYIIQKFLFNKK